MYLAWYDNSKKLTVQEKIENAYARYVEKFDSRPAEVLLNPADLQRTTQEGNDLSIPLHPLDYISPNTFWIGTPEDNT